MAFDKVLGRYETRVGINVAYYFSSVSHLYKTAAYEICMICCYNCYLESQV